MPRDPFAPILRKQRLRARAERWRRRALRPLRPSRLRPRREGPPSLVMVGVDTLRQDHVGPELMPDLHALGATGVDLRDVTAPAPWTLPSFAGALTGRMPGLHGAFLPGAVRNMDTQPPTRLDPQVRTLAHHLRDRGYATCALYANQFFAFGLAESFGEHRYLNLAAEDLLAVAADWIRRHADRPFFCFVLLNDPHEPTTPPDDLLRPELAALDIPPPDAAELRHLAGWGDPARPDRHLGLCGWPLPEPARRTRQLKRAVYRATVRQVDRALGRLVGQLDRWGLTERTLVTVFSDHGEEFCEHGAEAQAWDHDPRRVRAIGHGHTQFQELLHVPWLSWGAGVPTADRVQEPVSLLDLAPTHADWLGAGPLPLPEAPLGALTGRSLAAGNPEPDRVVLAEALAFGPDVVAVRRGPWKLVTHRDGRPLGLYDLARDPRERDDRHTQQTDVLRELQALLATWRDAAPAGGAPRRGGGADAGGWDSLDDEVRRRLKDLGYGE
jgi:arylsulfatase A-like enzyme